MELTGTTTSELENALDYMENSLNVGERTRLQIVTDILPTQEELNQTYYDLISMGIHTSKPVARISNGFPSTELTITKGSPALPIAIIPLIALLSIVGIVSFGIIKIEAISKALVPLLLIGGGVVIAVIAAVSASPRAAGVAEKALTRGR